jgi:predicted nucleotidyltransferase
MSPRVQIDADRIADFCRRWNVTELALFGSVLRDDFRVDSDVDVLITLSPDAHVGLFDLAHMERELTDILGHKVDLVTKGGLKAGIRDSVLSSAEVLYAA